MIEEHLKSYLRSPDGMDLNRRVEQVTRYEILVRLDRIADALEKLANK
jgi:hypothetical protein